MFLWALYGNPHSLFNGVYYLPGGRYKGRKCRVCGDGESLGFSPCTLLTIWKVKTGFTGVNHRLRQSQKHELAGDLSGQTDADIS